MRIYQSETSHGGGDEEELTLCLLLLAMWLALVLLGMLQARRHGLLSFLIISSRSRPPARRLPHAHCMRKLIGLLHSCQGFAEPPVMIFPTVMFSNGQEAFTIFFFSSVSWRSVIHWVTWEIVRGELWMSMNVSMKTWKMGFEGTVCIISCSLYPIKNCSHYRNEKFT